MAKKITAILICAIMIAMMIPVAASAANQAKFRVRLAEQTDKTATVVVEFADGTGFNAIDFEVKYNKGKLTLTDAKMGSGFKAFRDENEENGKPVIGSSNMETNPIKVSIATINPFKKVNDDGILLRMSFSKINGANVSEADVKLSVTNCKTSSAEDIPVSIEYVMDAQSAANNAQLNSTAYAQKTSMDNIDDMDSDDGSKPAAEENGSTPAGGDSAQESAQAGDSAESKDEDSTVNKSAADAEQTESGKAMTNKTKTVVIVVAGIVLAFGLAVLITVIVKNKKKQETEFIPKD